MGELRRAVNSARTRSASLSDKRGSGTYRDLHSRSDQRNAHGLLRFMRNEENVSIRPIFNGREAVTQIPSMCGNLCFKSLYLLLDYYCDCCFTDDNNKGY